MSRASFPLPQGFTWQYDLIVWLQSYHSAMLDRLAVAFSYLGNESFYFAALPVLMLAVDRVLGMRLAYVFFTSMYLNAWLKSYYHIARPIGVPGIRSGDIRSATGLSMPSGHAQGTMTFFTALALWLRRPVWILCAVLLSVAVGISRVYLGLHWPMDVVIGWVAGLAIGFCGWQIGRWWTYRGVPFGAAVALAVLFPAILLVLARDVTSAVYAVFLLVGGVGAALEKRFLRTSLDPVLWKRVAAGVIALGGVVAVQLAVQAHLEEPLWQYTRAAAVAAWATVLAPWLFQFLGLYTREADSHRDR
ncbi:MAG: phosphatase PAP2 family protein [Alicyclobacillus mali]|uniref:phosphatase PAP2 family protein n=1 Tax=Alicyclobacillus mali (ex Roth et al. 2021) TaxID=1123961 RepID=UPI0023F2BC3F|nr:phosphatase PAP2 family protein [Alicyclobacillus mali (ex Roth et al. 2021)]MCL6487748.1 phosphatase PAP2 family protein [Alicyclobacillus mali (ex Roth et al. 2021)]